MTPAVVVLRDAARADLEQAIAFYVGEGADEAAARLIDEIEQALDHIARHPEAGSPRYGHELQLPGLRTWLLHTHPYLIFYVASATQVDVWRILHGERDIPAWMR